MTRSQAFRPSAIPRRICRRYRVGTVAWDEIMSTSGTAQYRYWPALNCSAGKCWAWFGSATGVGNLSSFSSWRISIMRRDFAFIVLDNHSAHISKQTRAYLREGGLVRVCRIGDCLGMHKTVKTL